MQANKRSSQQSANMTFNIENLKVTVNTDDIFFMDSFNAGNYWDIETLNKLEKYIDKNKNIIEIGAHMGSSTLIYSRYTNKKVYAYEPQQKMFQLLERNITQNNIKNVEIFNKAIFYKNGNTFMDSLNTHKIDTRGFNRGGLSLGSSEAGGEETEIINLDSLNIDSGFLHIDAQGAEQGIIYGGQNFIKRNLPTILYEDNFNDEKSLVDRVNLDKSIPQEVKNFNIDNFLKKLNYTLHKKWAGIDTLAIPPIATLTNKKTAYVDLEANGMGCHVTSIIMSMGYCINNNLELKYLPFPTIHHNKGYKNYNNQIEEVFNFKNLGEKNTSEADNNSLKIDYSNIYFKKENISIAGIEKLRSFFKPKTTIIYDWVIHIRRNDVNLKEHPERYIEIEKYNEIIRKIRKTYQGVINIFTDGNIKDFIDLEDKNCLIDFDSPSLDVFSIMANCKNLLVGWSSFSWAAGVYNKNNVYCDILKSNSINYYHPILDHWKCLISDSVAIVGMCKNVAHFVSRVERVFKNIIPNFSNVYIYIYTNDNTDNTLKELEKFKKNIDVCEFIIENETGITKLNRQDLSILVYGRNKGLEYARKKKVNYMMVIDLDDACKYSPSSYFKEMKDLCSNPENVCISYAPSIYEFGDKFSLRSNKFPKCFYTLKDHTEIWNDILPSKTSKVFSYFGGYCLYNMKNIPKNSKYYNKDKEGNYACEHVCLNEQLIGNHYILCGYDS